MEIDVPFRCYYCREAYAMYTDLANHVDGCPQFRAETVFQGIRCGNCSSSVQTIRRYKDHLVRCHTSTSSSRSWLSSPSLPESDFKFGYPGIAERFPPSVPSPVFSESCESFPPTRPTSPEPDCVLSLPTDSRPWSNHEIASKLTHQMAAIVSKSFEDSGMMEKTVQFFMDKFMHYQQEVYSYGLENLYRRYNHPGLSDCCENTLRGFLSDHKDIMEAAFKPMRSNHTRLGYFIKLGTYIEPLRVYAINEKFETETRVVAQKPPEKPTDNYVLFVPMRRVLQKLFEIPSFFQQVLECEEARRKEPEVTSFTESATWLKSARERDHGDDGSYFFPIHIYYDDFEAGNALGSHSGRHKLGGVYYSLPFLPQRLSSKLKFIMLALVFKSRVREKQGNKAVFQPVIDELNFLYEQGIRVTLETGQSIIIKFALGCLIGDNLGLNAMMGFSTGFRSTRCCRICRITKDDYGKVLVEDPSLLRTKENHLKDIEAGDISTGVAEECVWYQIPYFRLETHTSVDFMHDLFEGVARYVMQVVLKGIISRNQVVSVSYLNDRINNLHYGPDSHSRPPPISSPKAYAFTLRMSASEMKNFVAYFGLMIGHLITVEDYDPPLPGADDSSCCDSDNEGEANVGKNKRKRSRRLFKKPKAPPHRINKRSSTVEPEIESLIAGVYEETPFQNTSKQQKHDDSGEFYKLYLLLNKVIHLIRHDSASPARAEYLRHVIAIFLTTYVRVVRLLGSSNSNALSADCEESVVSLQPKFHFLTHYPTMMLRHGPLLGLSSMRFESKNKGVKTGLKNSFNNINTPYSAAKKEQYHLNNLFFENTMPTEDDDDVKWYPVGEPDLTDLSSSLGISPDPHVLKTIRTVTTSSGVTFVPGYVVCMDLEDYGDPIFFKIDKLYFNIMTREVYFRGDNFLTLSFSPHYCAYQVEPLGLQTYHKLSDRRYLFPDTFVKAFDRCCYIKSRNSL